MNNKVALITGGGRGIGLGISMALAEAGYQIAICGRKDESECALTLEDIRSLGVKAFYCKADISDRADRDHLLGAIKTEFGGLNILINNAGIASLERTDILNAGEESFDRVISVNLKGPYFLTQLVANYFVEQKETNPEFEGSVVNVSSISATVASTNRGDYCLSKSAISMATKLWATRLAEWNIPVYEIQPGIIKTDMTSGVTTTYDSFISNGGTLQKRWGLPEDIGKAALSLIRGDIPYATGQVLVIDGGLTLPRL